MENPPFEEHGDFPSVFSGVKCHLGGCSLIKFGLASEAWSSISWMPTLTCPSASRKILISTWIFQGVLSHWMDGKGCLHHPWGFKQHPLEGAGMWWFQMIFIFTQKKLGEEEPILTNMFQLGWNLKPPTSIFFVEKNRQVTGWFWRVFAFGPEEHRLAFDASCLFCFSIKQVRLLFHQTTQANT